MYNECSFHLEMGVRATPLSLALTGRLREEKDFSGQSPATGKEMLFCNSTRVFIYLESY